MHRDEVGSVSAFHSVLEDSKTYTDKGKARGIGSLFPDGAGARSTGFGARKTKQITNTNMFEVIMTKHFLE